MKRPRWLPRLRRSARVPGVWGVRAGDLLRGLRIRPRAKDSRRRRSVQAADVGDSQAMAPLGPLAIAPTLWSSLPQRRQRRNFPARSPSEPTG